MANNRRFIANHADGETLRALSSLSEEQVGRKGRVWIVEGEGSWEVSLRVGVLVLVVLVLVMAMGWFGIGVLRI